MNIDIDTRQALEQVSAMADDVGGLADTGEAHASPVVSGSTVVRLARVAHGALTALAEELRDQLAALEERDESRE